MKIKNIKILLANQSGWTFVETLIVISIILILTSTVGFMAAGYVDKARVVSARTQIGNLSIALDTYFMDTTQYPSAEQGLAALWIKPILEPVPSGWDGPYVKKPEIRDPWKKKYEYTIPGPHGLPYGIRSFGKDGIPGGEGTSSDIFSWGDR